MDSPEDTVQFVMWSGDTASVEPAGTAIATVMCRCDTETFVLSMTGRLPLSDATAQGRLVAEEGEAGGRLCAVVWGA